MPRFDFDKLRAEALTRNSARRRSTAQELPAADLGVGGHALDVLAGVPRGIEGLAQDVYGLVDLATFDALPDYDAKFLGESQTVAGGVVEGASNFLAGFIPVVGWVGKAGKIGRIARGARGLRRGVLKATGSKTAARLSTRAIRDATAGAIVDFVAFDGHEQRLSNLLEKAPGLEDSVFSYLAADADDPELVGRLKNVVEGAGLGVFFDGIFLSLKALRAGRQARARGATPDEIEDAIDEAVDPRLLADAIPGNFRPKPARQAGAGPGAPPPFDEDPRFRFEDTDEALTPEAAALKETGETTIPGPDAPRSTLLRPLGIDDTKAEEIFAAVEARTGDPALNPRNLSGAELLSEELERTGDLNLSAYQGEEGALQLLRVVERVFRPVIKAEVPATQVVSLAEQESRAFLELSNLAQAGDGQALMARLQSDLPGLLSQQQEIGARVHAYKLVLQAQATHVSQRAKLIRSGDASERDMAQIVEELERLSDFMAGVRGLVAEQGRQLGSNRIPVRAVNPDDLGELVKGLGGTEKIKDLAYKLQVAFEGSGASGITKLARVGGGRRFVNIMTEAWINSVLSGPRTFAVNVLGGLLTSIYRPLENMLGGALTLQSDVIKDTVQEVVFMTRSVGESFRLARATWKSGRNQLSPLHQVVDLPFDDAISGRNVGAAGDSTAAAFVNALGKFVRWPTRALSATDEFLKQMNFRGVAQAKLARQAQDLGLDATQSARFIADSMDRLIFDGQALTNTQLFRRGLQQARATGVPLFKQRDEALRFVNETRNASDFADLEAISQASLARAEEVTFTKPLRQGSLAARLTNAVNAMPLLRLVVPFIRTPTNIVVFAGQRLDAPRFVKALVSKRFPRMAKNLEHSRNRMVTELRSNDPKVRSEAIGRMAAGGAIATYIYAKASERTEDGFPLITGRGPSDPEQRQILEAAGWLPYSVRIGQSYVQYRRLDPFASMMGLAADISDYTRFADSTDTGPETFAYAMATAVAANFTNKTYLTGLSRFIDALEDPQRQMPKWFQSLGGSFFPPNIAAQATQALGGDPYLREIRSMADARLSRTPGMSDELPPLRNVLGEPIRRVSSVGTNDVARVLDWVVPIGYREVSDDKIAREFAALGHGFTPPKAVANGIDLHEFRNRNGRTAYDRWLELHGKTKIRGRTLRQSLGKLLRSKSYQRLSAVSTHDIDSPRIALISNLIQDYRRAAKRQMMREFPEVRAADRAIFRQRRTLLQGRDTRPSVLQRSGN